MSSTTPLSSQVTSSRPSAAPTQQQQQSDGNNSINFYRNLFYILIGLLGVFALISIFSLIRARRRRRLVHAEAIRLGVLVPGMPGYISMRERRAAQMGPNGRKGLVDTTHPPDWWEVGAEGWMKAWVRPSAPSRGYSGSGGGMAGASLAFTSSSFAGPSKSPHYTDEPEYTDLITEKSTHFCPLAIIPPQPTDNPAERPLPVSTLKYFPINSAYRPEDLLPPPLVWGEEGMDAGQLQKQLEGLQGERVDVVTMIRMPETPEQIEVREKAARKARMGGGDEEEEDGEEVLREWGGVCLGVIRVGVGNEEGRDRDNGAGTGKGGEV